MAGCYALRASVGTVAGELINANGVESRPESLRVIEDK